MAQKQKKHLKQIHKWGMDFVEKWVLKKKNDNMIRLVPARIESGRSWSLFLGILGLEAEAF